MTEAEEFATVVDLRENPVGAHRALHALAARLAEAERQRAEARGAITCAMAAINSARYEDAFAALCDAASIKETRE